MSRVRGSDNLLEASFRKKLWARGVRYRLGYKLLGKPDLVFVSAKLAVFVDGCFWHGCPIHGQLPQTNKAFWQEKLAKNKLRDENVSEGLVSLGWKVLRLWEHELKTDPEGCLDRVIELVEKGNNASAPTKARRPGANQK